MTFIHSLIEDSWNLLLISGRHRSVLQAWIEKSICDTVNLDDSVKNELLASFNPLPFQDKSHHLFYATRDRKLSMFKAYRFTPQVEEYYSRTQSSREKVIYSLIRNQNLSLLSEISLSVKEGELDFSSASIRWSEGPESAQGGRIGPISMLSIGDAPLREKLESSAEGDIIGPFPIGGTYAVVRLDKRIASRLDDQLQLHLIEELYQQWLIKQIETLEKGETIEPIDYLPD